MPENGLLELRPKGDYTRLRLALCCLLYTPFFNITVTRPDHESYGPIYAACCTRRC
ncbi:hypothetical protein HACA111877_03225 [Halomonas casei]